MNKNKINNANSGLTATEQKRFIALALEGAGVSSDNDFEAWVRGCVRPFFPHEMLIAGKVRNDFTEIAINGLLAVDFPISYVEEVRLSRGTFTCPTLNGWFGRRFRPQLFDPAAGQGAEMPWAQEFDKFELKNVAAHGVIATDHRSATYFSFSRIPGALSDRHIMLLELLVPHLHQTYARVETSVNRQAGRTNLTGIDGTLLNWISKGKSDSDIATILGRSPHAIKHSVRQLISKLNAGTRHEAVAKAAWLDPVGIKGDPKKRHDACTEDRAQHLSLIVSTLT